MEWRRHSLAWHSHMRYGVAAEGDRIVTLPLPLMSCVLRLMVDTIVVTTEKKGHAYAASLKCGLCIFGKLSD